jgi:hypothetical protein
VSQPTHRTTPAAALRTEEAGQVIRDQRYHKVCRAHVAAEKHARVEHSRAGADDLHVLQPCRAIQLPLTCWLAAIQAWRCHSQGTLITVLLLKHTGLRVHELWASSMHHNKILFGYGYYSERRDFPSHI